MTKIRLNEQIAFLRKQKGITQEELAQTLGVTNQSISKWESSLCCPDIQLLPQIAAYFNVSIDELLGYKPVDTFENVYLKIKFLFESAPAEDAFSIAFKLAALLHEGACTRGYKGYAPWDTSSNHSLGEEYYKWGFSACSEPEGITVHQGNSVFISDNKITQPINQATIREVFTALKPLCEPNTLRVLFNLYELTIKDFDHYVSLETVEEKCKLPKEVISSALDNLPLQIKVTEDGTSLYRIEGWFMHIPSILLMLTNR